MSFRCGAASNALASGCSDLVCLNMSSSYALRRGRRHLCRGQVIHHGKGGGSRPAPHLAVDAILRVRYRQRIVRRILVRRSTGPLHLDDVDPGRGQVEAQRLRLAGTGGGGLVVPGTSTISRSAFPFQVRLAMMGPARRLGGISVMSRRTAACGAWLAEAPHAGTTTNASADASVSPAAQMPRTCASC